MDPDTKNRFGEGEAPQLPVRPDYLDTFRTAQLLLLLATVNELEVKKPVDLERLGFYDFFAANPFLVLGDDRNARRIVTLAGFSSADLSYQSSGHRYTNRRGRLQRDLTVLVGLGLARAEVNANRVVFAITQSGQVLAQRFESLYARAYQESSRLIVRRLDKLSDKRLRADAKRWLNDERLLIDLYDLEPAA